MAVDMEDDILNSINTFPINIHFIKLGKLASSVTYVCRAVSP